MCATTCKAKQGLPSDAPALTCLSLLASSLVSARTGYDVTPVCTACAVAALDSFHRLRSSAASRTKGQANAGISVKGDLGREERERSAVQLGRPGQSKARGDGGGVIVPDMGEMKACSGSGSSRRWPAPGSVPPSSSGSSLARTTCKVRVHQGAAPMHPRPRRR